MRLLPADARFVSRCLFAGLLVLFFPLKTPYALGALGSSHFHPPLGPFAFFDRYPPQALVLALEAIAFALLAAWVAGRGRWIVGGALTLVLTILCGFTYSAGKVDHDFAILLFPLLITLPLRSPPSALFFCLGVTYASSALAKAAGGWLDPTTQATLSWALLYEHNYHANAPLLGWVLSTLPGWSWELLDLGTILFELIVPLAILTRFRLPVLLALPFFHLAILLLFGIDFSPLLLLYAPLAILCFAADPKAPPLSDRARRLTSLVLVVALGGAFILRMVRGDYSVVPLPLHPPGYLLFPLFAAALAIQARIHAHEAPPS